MPAFRPFALGLVLVLGACGKKGAEESTKAPPAPPVKVPLVTAKLGDTPQQIVISGTVVADQRADVTADTAGKVINVMVERGKRVKQGEPVVQLDVRNAALGAREAQANLASARAQRSLAQEECKRTQTLFDKGAITKSEYDRQMTQCTSALQQVSAAEARAQMMRKSVTDGLVRAPFDGVVAEKMVAPGEWVNPGRPLFTLVDDDPLRIEISVPEIAIRAIKLDQHVDLVTVADPDHTYGATITRIGAEVGRSRSLIVEARIDKGSPFIPGMFAEAHITIGQVERPIVPRTAVQGTCDGQPQLVSTGGEGTPADKIESEVKCRGPWHVFVAIKGELEERVVQLGPSPGKGEVSIVQGVSKNEKVVAKITDKIVDGLRVVE